MLTIVRSVLGALVFSLALVFGGYAHAQDSGAVDNYRATLQAQLDALNAQIAEQQKIVDEKEKQSVSLQRDIGILNANIKQAQLSIKARDIAIQELTQGITQKEDTLFGLNIKLNRELESLAGLMRQRDQLDQAPLIVLALSSKSLSDFFSDLDTFSQIQAQMRNSFTEIQNTQQVTQKQKIALETEREEETKLRQVQQLQAQHIAAQQAQQKKILADTKGQEKAYQALIAANQKSAAQIRSALFQLTGSAAIPFGRALDYANSAAQATGIRPAFLLGVIAEESNLGENVGTGSWNVDMSPANRSAFKAITESLGLSPATMPVSKRAWYGWGGAMGPAQFIPLTWALYAGYIKPDWHYDSTKDRVGKLTGNTPPNPWDPKDAFMAAALYLTDNGAAEKTTGAEFRAAMCYLAGCSGVNNRSLQFYGQEVAALAKQYQAQIDILNGN